MGSADVLNQCEISILLNSHRKIRCKFINSYLVSICAIAMFIQIRFKLNQFVK